MINYTVGDLMDTKPVGNKSVIIAHCCNNKGGWGSGVVLAISKKWKLPEQSYRRWASGDRTPFLSQDVKNDSMPKFQLGNIQVVEVEDKIHVANMIAQHDVCFYGDIPPIRYDRLRQCFNKLAKAAKELDAYVALPRLGCGLAGGSWAVVEGLIKETLVPKGIKVIVYDLEGDISWK